MIEYQRTDKEEKRNQAYNMLISVITGVYTTIGSFLFYTMIYPSFDVLYLSLLAVATGNIFALIVSHLYDGLNYYAGMNLKHVIVEKGNNEGEE